MDILHDDTDLYANYGRVGYVLTHPRPSRDHTFTDEEKSMYDSLTHQGRTLYDGLRTEFNVIHMSAFVWALDLYGSKVKN